MKFKRNEKYESVFLYIVISALIIIAVFFLFSRFSWLTSALAKIISIISPIIYGAIIAYLCNPVLVFFQNKVFAFKKKYLITDKILPFIFTYLFVFTVIGLIVYIVIPQIVNNYEMLQNNIVNYFTGAQEWLDNLISSIDFFGNKYENLNDLFTKNEILTDFSNFINKSYSILSSVAEYIISYAGKFVIELKNLFMGLLLSVYFLASKKTLASQFKKLFSAIFSRKVYITIINIIRYTDKAFGAYIRGSLIDSVFVGIETFIILQIFRFPFAPLVALIIGVTNIIPIFGPFIGTIPSAFLILITEPSKVIWFILIIIIIQQIDGNFIAPRIIGSTTGLNSLWIIVSITIGGGLFGFAGMILAVPAFSVIYTVIKELTNKQLIKRGLSTENSFYINDPPYNNSNKLLIRKTPPKIKKSSHTLKKQAAKSNAASHKDDKIIKK